MQVITNRDIVRTAMRYIGQNFIENAVNSNLRDRLYRLLEHGTASRSVEVAPGLAIGSVKGPVRKDNQDRAVIARISRGDYVADNLTIIAVFDGMGGMVDGGAAAALAASTFIADLSSSTGPHDIRLVRALENANSEVFQKFHGRGGTTLTALAFNDDDFGYAIHVGDSRLYRRTRELTLVTTDDTVQGVVGDEVAYNADDFLDSQLIQFVGVGPEIQPHLIKMQHGRATWILTTDGAHGLGKTILQGISNSANTVADFVRKLTYVADAAGVHDNATVAALYLPDIVKNSPFDIGTTVSIWTPMSSLEIWIDFERVSHTAAADPDAHDTTTPKRPVIDKKAKARRPTRKKNQKHQNKKPSKDMKSDRHHTGDDESAPQLNITFGQGRNSSRD